MVKFLLQIVGNLIIALVLNILKSDEASNAETFPITDNNFSSNASKTILYTTTTFHINNVSILQEANPYQYCGANDCQDQEIIEESIDQYVPQNPFAVYIIIGSFLLMVVLGMICHIKMVPEMPLSSYNSAPRKHASSDDSDMEISVGEAVAEKKSIKQVTMIC